MTNKELDTKKKILRSAAELFAKSGFGGTSIREIAHQADVNVAAINYHFSNKQNLYIQVYVEGKKELKERIAELAAEGRNTEELAVGIFEVMNEMGDSLRNVFKMMLSDAGPSEGIQGEDMEEFGPPGGQYLVETIAKEVGTSDATALMWGVKSVFTHIIHWSLMGNTEYCRALRNERNLSTMLAPETIKQSVRHQVRSVLFYLKQANPQFGVPAEVKMKEEK